MSEDKRIAGPILAVVGGLVILSYAAYELYLAAFVSSVTSLNGFPVTDIGNLIVAGWIGVVLGFGIIVLSIALVADPTKHTLFGSLIILFAFLSLVSVGGGNGFGFLLGVLGGTCSIVFGPEDSLPRPKSSTISTAGEAPVSVSPSETGQVPTTLDSPPPVADASSRVNRTCPRCGKVSLELFSFCPSCGHKF